VLLHALDAVSHVACDSGPGVVAASICFGPTYFRVMLAVLPWPVPPEFALIPALKGQSQLVGSSCSCNHCIDRIPPVASALPAVFEYSV
jgi:hypothetical protein